MYVICDVRGDPQILIVCSLKKMSNLVTNKPCSLFLVLFICFLITPSHSDTCAFTKNWSIYIYNGIQDSTMNVHVKSADDDLGLYSLAYEEGFKFDFCESILGNTLYTGDFNYDARSVAFHVFDKEIENTIGCKYGGHANVYWLLKQDGYYLSRENKPFNDPVWMRRGPWE
ncbi:putative plant self-incompatibility S1 [Helianthus annuus]|nr:putative plant self-incompatibility S1 [Helianthus annuus]